MSEQTYELIERILIKASQERGRVHWAMIFAHSPEYIGKEEKQVIQKIADRWGVNIIGK